MRSLNKYVPAELVTVDVATLVASLVAVTFAPAIRAPDESVTVPLMPLSAWADALEADQRIKQTASAGASQRRKHCAETFGENIGVFILYLIEIKLENGFFEKDPTGEAT